MDVGLSREMWAHKVIGDCGSCWMGFRGEIAAGEDSNIKFTLRVNSEGTRS